jgi:citronellyl-CoA dehydrogenase
LPWCYISTEKAINETIDHLKRRIVFGKPLITKQVLRHRLVDWLTEIECIRQLTYHIVRMKMDGLDPTKEISMGKLFGARLMNKVMDGCLQMFGGMGYMNEMAISRAFRDSRLMSIGAGANEVMSEIIAKLEGF